jgi:hypothetical protein
MTKRVPRSIAASVVGKVFQILGGAGHSLTAHEIHAAMAKDRAATCSSVYRALLELRRRGVARIGAAGSRAARDARIESILAQPGRGMNEPGAMRFVVIGERKRREAAFAAQLETLTASLPGSKGKALMRDFYSLVFRPAMPTREGSRSRERVSPGARRSTRSCFRA